MPSNRPRRRRVIVAGGRNFQDRKMLARVMKDLYAGKRIRVVSGMARGADVIGKEWADDRGIPVKPFPANWDRDGKSAGHIRNGDMADYGDELVAFWDKESRGTQNMIQQMMVRGKTTHVYFFKPPKEKKKKGLFPVRRL